MSLGSFFIRFFYCSVISMLLLGSTSLNAWIGKFTFGGNTTYYYSDGSSRTVNSDTFADFIKSGDYDRWVKDQDVFSRGVQVEIDNPTTGGSCQNVSLGRRPNLLAMPSIPESNRLCVLSNGIEIRKGKKDVVEWINLGTGKQLTQEEIYKQDLASLWTYEIKRNYEVYDGFIKVNALGKIFQYRIDHVIETDVAFIDNFVDKKIFSTYLRDLFDDSGFSKDLVKTSEFVFVGMIDDPIGIRRYRIYRCKTVFTSKSEKKGKFLEIKMDHDLKYISPVQTQNVKFRDISELGKYDCSFGAVKTDGIVRKNIPDALSNKIEKALDKKNALDREFLGDKNATADLKHVADISDSLRKLTHDLAIEKDELASQKCIDFMNNFIEYAEKYIPEVSSVQDDFDAGNIQEIKLMSTYTLSAIYTYASFISKNIAQSSFDRELFEKVYSEQIVPQCQNLLKTVKGKPAEPIVRNTIRVVMSQLLSNEDLEKSAQMGSNGMPVSVYRVAQAAKEVAQTAKNEFETAQKLNGPKDLICRRSITPICTAFDEAGQVLDTFLEVGNAHADQILKLSLVNAEESFTEGFGKRMDRIAKEINKDISSTPSIADIGKHTALMDRIHQSLSRFTDKQGLLKGVCTISSKLNGLAMDFVVNGAPEYAAAAANFSKGLVLGALKEGASIALHPWDFTAALACGTVNTGIFLASEIQQISKLGDAMWKFDKAQLGDAFQAYCDYHKPMLKVFKASITKLQSMPAEQLGTATGEFGVNLVAGAYSFKALHLVAKGASPVVLDKVREFRDTIKAGQATEECLQTLPVMTKVAMEEGAEAAKNVGTIVGDNPSLFKQTEKPIGQVIHGISNDCKWTLPESGKMIDGRWYTKHALERMAPDTIEVRAILSSRAIREGYMPDSDEFIQYVDPRGIPPMVVENTIKKGMQAPGKIPGTIDFKGDKITVSVDKTSGNVVTIIPK